MKQYSVVFEKEEIENPVVSGPQFVKAIPQMSGQWPAQVVPLPFELFNIGEYFHLLFERQALNELLNRIVSSFIYVVVYIHVCYTIYNIQDITCIVKLFV